MVQSLPAGDAAQQLLRVLSRLKDDNLPRAVEWQQNRHQIDVALTWTEGISLADYLQNIREGRRPPVEPVQAVRLVNGLAHAVSHLQRHLQVAHGDLQPANVIVTSHPSRLQLIDFGSAWTIDRTTRRTEGDGHHRCYAAPEAQAGLTPVTLAGDQFSVSVALYELLTLQLPYGGLGGKAGRPEFIAQAADTLVAPSQISSGCKKLPRSLRERLDALVLRGLALKPENRYPDHNTWLNHWKELSALFHITPELKPIENILTRVIGWFVKPDSDPKRTGGS
jgi:serine/threonine protein kinase